MDISVLQAAVRSNLGDITFKEAYNKTKRILNISISSAGRFESARLLNYITAPNVVCFCKFFFGNPCSSYGVQHWLRVHFHSCLNLLNYLRRIGMATSFRITLLDKNGWTVGCSSCQTYLLGSVGADLPMTRLSELFNVNHFVVSQVNPHIAPFLYQFESRKGGLVPALLYLLKSEMKHRVTQVRISSVTWRPSAGRARPYPRFLEEFLCDSAAAISW